MYYGLQFNSSAGEALQVVINTAGLQVYARTTSGGTFGEWQFLCGATGAGSGGSFTEADKAKVADTAYRLSVPMQINFTGDVVGDVWFDGSQNVTCNLVVRDFDARIEQKAGAVVREAMNNESGEFHQKLMKSINSAISTHVVDWHQGGGSGGGNN